MTAKVPSGQQAARIEGMLVVDDAREVPFAFEVPPGRSHLEIVDVNYTPPGQVVKQYSAVRLQGSDRVASKLTAGTVSPKPHSLEIWVGGHRQFWTRLS